MDGSRCQSFNLLFGESEDKDILQTPHTKAPAGDFQRCKSLLVVLSLKLAFCAMNNRQIDSEDIITNIPKFISFCQKLFIPLKTAWWNILSSDNMNEAFCANRKGESNVYSSKCKGSVIYLPCDIQQKSTFPRPGEHRLIALQCSGKSISWPDQFLNPSANITLWYPRKKCSNHSKTCTFPETTCFLNPICK